MLKDIRDEIRATRTDLVTRIDGTNARLDETNARVEQIAHAQKESEIRLATELVALREPVNQVVKLLRADRTTRAQMADHEKRIASLEKRTKS